MAETGVSTGSLDATLRRNRIDPLVSDGPHIRFAVAAPLAISRSFAVSGRILDGATRGGPPKAFGVDPWLIFCAHSGHSVAASTFAQKLLISRFVHCHFKTSLQRKRFLQTMFNVRLRGARLHSSNPHSKVPRFHPAQAIPSNFPIKPP